MLNIWTLAKKIPSKINTPMSHHSMNTILVNDCQCGPPPSSLPLVHLSVGKLTTSTLAYPNYYSNFSTQSIKPFNLAIPHFDSMPIPPTI